MVSTRSVRSSKCGSRRLRDPLALSGIPKVGATRHGFAPSRWAIRGSPRGHRVTSGRASRRPKSFEAPGGAQPNTHPPAMRSPSAGVISPRAICQSERSAATAGNPRPSAATTGRSRAAPPDRERSAGVAKAARRAAQQMGLAIEQSEERFRAHRPRDQIGHAPLGIGDAARPATPVAGASLRKPSARIPLGSHGGIWTKRLRFLDLGS